MHLMMLNFYSNVIRECKQIKQTWKICKNSKFPFSFVFMNDVMSLIVVRCHEIMNLRLSIMSLVIRMCQSKTSEWELLLEWVFMHSMFRNSPMNIYQRDNNMNCISLLWTLEQLEQIVMKYDEWYFASLIPL